MMYQNSNLKYKQYFQNENNFQQQYTEPSKQYNDYQGQNQNLPNQFPFNYQPSYPQNNNHNSGYQHQPYQHQPTKYQQNPMMTLQQPMKPQMKTNQNQNTMKIDPFSRDPTTSMIQQAHESLKLLKSKRPNSRNRIENQDQEDFFQKKLERNLNNQFPSKPKMIDLKKQQINTAPQFAQRRVTSKNFEPQFDEPQNYQQNHQNYQQQYQSNNQQNYKQNSNYQNQPNQRQQNTQEHNQNNNYQSNNKPYNNQPNFQRNIPQQQSQFDQNDQYYQQDSQQQYQENSYYNQQKPQQRQQKEIRQPPQSKYDQYDSKDQYQQNSYNNQQNPQQRQQKQIKQPHQIQQKQQYQQQNKVINVDDLPAYATGNKNIDIDDSAKPMFECREGCGRKFAEENLSRHEQVCKKVFQEKRKAFNIAEKRIVSTEQVQLLQSKANKKQQPKKADPNKKPNWKLQSQAFRAILKQNTNPESMTVQEKQAMQEVFEEAQGLKMCDYCSRKFNQKALERHAPFCKDKQQKNAFKNPPNKKR